MKPKNIIIDKIQDNIPSLFQRKLHVKSAVRVKSESDLETVSVAGFHNLSPALPVHSAEHGV